MISFGSILSGMIAVVLLSIYGYFFITHIKRPVYMDMRFLVLLLLIAGIRMFLPFNLPINVTIPSKQILVPAADIAFHVIPGTDFYIYQIAFSVIFIISIILLVNGIYKYRQFRKGIALLTHTDAGLNNTLINRPLYNSAHNISAVYIQGNISPFVYGTIEPVIVVPENIYSDNELEYVLDHELTHIIQHDTSLKSVFYYLTAIFWWNPFIWMIKRHADSAIEISNDISLYNKMNEQEKTDYASLLVKTAGLSKHVGADYSLSLVSHNDPLIKRRVEQILSAPPILQNHALLPLHILAMVLILTASFIITPEPYAIHDDKKDDSFLLEEEFNSEDNSYILQTEDGYELYVDGAFVCDFYEIPDEFKEYPVYKEKPEDGK